MSSQKKSSKNKQKKRSQSRKRNVGGITLPSVINTNISGTKSSKHRFNHEQPHSDVQMMSYSSSHSNVNGKKHQQEHKMAYNSNKNKTRTYQNIDGNVNVNEYDGLPQGFTVPYSRHFPQQSRYFNMDLDDMRPVHQDLLTFNLEPSNLINNFFSNRSLTRLNNPFNNEFFNDFIKD
tara:strand:+ start:1301 stop:1831 length:531 start_codon:yes stop_codon:yes gene_type:complete